MNTIPTNLARVPTLLSSQILLSSMNSISQRLLNTQIQLATGRIINRPSDNAIGSSTISVLDDILERRDQRLRNLSHAESVLNTGDAALNDAGDFHDDTVVRRNPDLALAVVPAGGNDRTGGKR